MKLVNEVTNFTFTKFGIVNFISEYLKPSNVETDNIDDYIVFFGNRWYKWKNQPYITYLYCPYAAKVLLIYAAVLRPECLAFTMKTCEIVHKADGLYIFRIN